MSKLPDDPARLVMNVASKEKVAFAREQRRQPTRAERLLWRYLRQRHLGTKFRRQHPLGDFVLDFYCAEEQLAVEVDGPGHLDQAGYDQWRDAALAALGVRVLRIAEAEVRADPEGVLRRIARCLTPHPPLRNGEGE